MFPNNNHVGEISFFTASFEGPPFHATSDMTHGQNRRLPLWETIEKCPNHVWPEHAPEGGIPFGWHLKRKQKAHPPSFPLFADLSRRSRPCCRAPYVSLFITQGKISRWQSCIGLKQRIEGNYTEKPCAMVSRENCRENGQPSG